MHFRDYDKRGLDAQYNLREVVPTFQEYFDQWDIRSKDTRDSYPCDLDIPYGSAPLECLDIFPSGLQNSPVMVFIHGGYWQGSDKSQFSYLAQGFIPAGITFAAVNYSLAPEVAMDEIVHQGRKALTWVWQHAEEFGYNSDRIFVSGHSAGGHLASLLASTDWPNFDSGLPPDLIKGLCAISGIYACDVCQGAVTIYFYAPGPITITRTSSNLIVIRDPFQCCCVIISSTCGCVD